MNNEFDVLSATYHNEINYNFMMQEQKYTKKRWRTINLSLIISHSPLRKWTKAPRAKTFRLEFFPEVT